MFEKVFEKIVGKYIAHKLKLEDSPMETTPWFKSKTIWSDVVTILLAVVGFVDAHYSHGKIATSPAYQLVLSLLGAIGIYGRSTADTKIG